MNVFADSKSPISLAFLDERNDAEYIFYKDHPHDQLDFVYPDIQPDDIVLFSSFYAVNPVIRPQIVGLLEYARAHGAIIYYDVNYRSSHRNEVMKITPNYLENLEYADIVRGSREDFDVLYKMRDPDKIYTAEVSFYCKKFICTQGADTVELRADQRLKRSYPVPPTSTVSTVGAGDNFNAGFIYGLLKYGITRNDLAQGLTPEQWDKVVACGMEFSAAAARVSSTTCRRSLASRSRRSAKPKACGHIGRKPSLPHAQLSQQSIAKSTHFFSTKEMLGANTPFSAHLCNTLTISVLHSQFIIPHFASSIPPHGLACIAPR